jgi:hypothetical protein
MSIEEDISREMDKLNSPAEKSTPATPRISTVPTRQPLNGADRKPDAGERLMALARMRNERKALYGDNYIRAGYAMAFMLGKIELRTPRDYIRMGLLVQEFSKLSRYSVQWEKGHPDSLDDISVYAQLLQEVDAMTEEEMGKHITKSLWEK